MTQPETTQPEKKRRGRKPRGVSMNHCAQCRKFVSFEPGEPEDQGLQVTVEVVEGERSHEVSLSGCVRLTLTCADCSAELAETTLEFEESWTLEHTDECQSFDPADSSCIDENTPEIELEEDSTGKGMYSKHFWGAKVSVSVSCKECNACVEEGETIMEQASSFEVTG